MHFSLSDFLMDAVQNSIEAGSTKIEVSFAEFITPPVLKVSVKDNGRGMNEEELRKALDPFYSDGTKHPGRRQGLGLPFLQQECESLGGSLNLVSEKGRGTELTYTLPLDHTDTPPLGDLVSTFIQTLTFDQKYELDVTRVRGGNFYRFTRSELEEALGDLTQLESISLLKTYLESLEDNHG